MNITILLTCLRYFVASAFVLRDSEWLYWKVELIFSCPFLLSWNINILPNFWNYRPENEGLECRTLKLHQHQQNKQVIIIILHWLVFSMFPALIFSGDKKCWNMVWSLAKHTESIQLAVLINLPCLRRNRFVHGHMA